MLKVPGWFTSTANWKLAGRWTAVDGDAAKSQQCFLVIIQKLERAITSEDWSTWIVMLNYVVIARSESSQSSLAVPVLALNAYFTITLKPFLPSFWKSLVQTGIFIFWNWSQLHLTIRHAYKKCNFVAINNWAASKSLSCKPSTSACSCITCLISPLFCFLFSNVH